MSNAVAKNQTDLEILSSTLLSTLEESIFFSELSKHLASSIKADRVLVYRVGENGTSKLICENFKAATNGVELGEGVGLAAQVARTRRPYFSNSVERDPLLSREAAEGIKSELAIPVSHEGSVITTIHFQSLTEENEYSREDITAALSVIGNVQAPIANMKMYLSAMALNEALVKQLKEQEVKIASSSPSTVVENKYTTTEKDIIGNSDAMDELLTLVEKVASNKIHAVIEGESGTGKEMVARRVHCRSMRACNAYVIVDCSGREEIALAELLFGRDDMSGTTIGAIENANSGTLVLKNIDKLTVAIQTRLAQFMKDGVAVRLGGSTPFRSDVRVLAISGSSLIEMVEEGTFRDDLYYALNTVNLQVPSLKERTEDIVTIAHHFLNNGKNEAEHKTLAPSALRLLVDYSWPNNVRELQSIMERAYILTEGMIVDENGLADKIVNATLEKAEEVVEDYAFNEMTLNELERKHICKTLEFLGGNKTRTAKALGITVKTLYNKLHSYDMIEVKEA